MTIQRYRTNEFLGLSDARASGKPSCTVVAQARVSCMAAEDFFELT